jgi:hypothetical protein
MAPRDVRNGWLEAAACDGYHMARLESHDRAPDNDRAEWSDVPESCTPATEIRRLSLV